MADPWPPWRCKALCALHGTLRLHETGHFTDPFDYTSLRLWRQDEKAPVVYVLPVLPTRPGLMGSFWHDSAVICGPHKCITSCHLPWTRILMCVSRGWRGVWTFGIVWAPGLPLELGP